jgi:hypothetical protein
MSYKGLPELVKAFAILVGSLKPLDVDTVMLLKKTFKEKDYGC